MSSQHTLLNGSGPGKALGLLTWGVVIAAVGLVVWIWMRSERGVKVAKVTATNVVVPQGHKVAQKAARSVQVAAREVLPDTQQFRPSNPEQKAASRLLQDAPQVIASNSVPSANTTNPGKPLPVPLRDARVSERPQTVAIKVQEAGTNAGTLERILRAQVALVAQGISPGSVDGVMGSQTRVGLKTFQRKENLAVTGQLDDVTWERLKADGTYLADYIVREDDVERLQPLGRTWLAKSMQTCLEYETVLELVAEKSQASPTLLRRINPDVNWDSIAAGTKVKVPTTAFPELKGKAAFARIYLAERVLEAFDESTNLLAHFPCSIGQKAEKRPVGELHIAVLALNPNYTFDPEVFPESDEARELGRKLILQPGPNNPVGTVWIGLDKPGYGIHGTPKPEQVGRTESHGCFRLANWNAEYFAKLVWVGMPVMVEK